MKLLTYMFVSFRYNHLDCILRIGEVK